MDRKTGTITFRRADVLKGSEDGETFRHRPGQFPGKRDPGRVLAWAGVGPYRPRACYDRVAEFSVYADRNARGSGAAQSALQR